MKTRLSILLLAGLGFLSACGAEFEFVVIGDTRPPFESESFRNFETLIPKINALKPALVINLGDLIYGYGLHRKEKQWDKYQQVIKAIEPPYYQVPGNHDTHSKEARRIYGRRFGKFYQSFDYGGCHFVLLDNTEEQRWGCLGAAELSWLKDDLKHTSAQSVFVFLHFPVWEPERVTPQYYEFWARELHPLFKASRVRAVFAGHYHSYGPTREFDGIRYFITGGGGAELRPEYKKSGGGYHFVKVRVSGGAFDTRVVTGHGELTDTEADVMGGLQFADKNSSRIGIKQNSQDLKTGRKVSILLNNPYSETLGGKARWVLDASAFSIDPSTVSMDIPSRGAQQYSFTMKALKDTVTLQSLPRLEFNIVAGLHHHQFHRDVLFLQEMSAPYRRAAPALDGQLADWDGLSPQTLDGGSKIEATIRAFHDGENLYLALTVPAAKTADAEELGFTDDLQIGFAHRLSDTDFACDFLRLGFSCSSPEAKNRTPSRKAETVVPGVRSICGMQDGRRSYEISIPLKLLEPMKTDSGNSLVLNLSFPVPNGEAEEHEPSDPGVNTISYRVRYGNDSLVPVHFLELNLMRKH